LTSEEKKRSLVQYRIKQAEESLEEAKFLFEGNKSPRSVINRAYYSMFYAVLALLIYEPFSTSKHSGVVGYFNKHFIKEGLFDKEYGRSLNKAFELRQREDYREFVNLEMEHVTPFIQKAEDFIRAVQEYLRKEKGIKR